jgi:hypothetical protein
MNQMTQICAHWLRARDNFYGGENITPDFAAADRLLLCALAEGWSPSFPHLTLAFESLRKSLATLTAKPHHH